MLTSTVDFGQCSDATDFRASATPIDVSTDSYLIYKVAADGKSAVGQDCLALDSTTCSPADGGIVWSIAGTELTTTQQNSDPIGTGGCSLQQTQTWTIQDQTRKMSLEIDNVLTLVNSKPACDQVEANLKARSPNTLGVEGCVVTFKLTGALR